MTTIDVIAQTQVLTVSPITQTLTVNPLTGTVIVGTSATPSVTVTNAGPIGPAGFAAGYNHTQSSALTTWTINHNLGYKPTVQVFTTGGLEVLAEVQHVSANQVTITFNSAVSGTARLV